jgi:hypothetical protein
MHTWQTKKLWGSPQIRFRKTGLETKGWFPSFRDPERYEKHQIGMQRMYTKEKADSWLTWLANREVKIDSGGRISNTEILVSTSPRNLGQMISILNYSAS